MRRGSAAKPKAARPKRCDPRKGGCGQMFTPVRPMQAACCQLCALNFVSHAKARAAALAAKEERKADKVKLDGMKRLGELRSEAQAVFNRYIRLRDVGMPCICCGKPLGEERFGGAYDAGHYLSRGSHPNLAFDEVNVNAQRKSCNRPGGTTAAQFRLGMIERYGLEAVERLEADKEPRRYRHDDYREIKRVYAAKARELLREGG